MFVQPRAYFSPDRAQGQNNVINDSSHKNSIDEQEGNIIGNNTSLNKGMIDTQNTEEQTTPLNRTYDKVGNDKSK